jgi:hypothetical protein
MPDQWKKSYLGAAARAEVAAYFTKCLLLLDARKLDEAEHCLSRGRWRSAVDLSAVPTRVVDATDGLCADAVGLIEYGNTEAINRVVSRIIALWQIGAMPALVTQVAAADHQMA